MSMSRPRSYLYDRMVMSYLYNHDMIVINHVTSLKQTDLFFVLFLEYLLLLLVDSVHEESE